MALDAYTPSLVHTIDTSRNITVHSHQTFDKTIYCSKSTNLPWWQTHSKSTNLLWWQTHSKSTNNLWQINLRSTNILWQTHCKKEFDFGLFSHQTFILSSHQPFILSSHLNIILVLAFQNLLSSHQKLSIIGRISILFLSLNSSKHSLTFHCPLFLLPGHPFDKTNALWGYDPP